MCYCNCLSGEAKTENGLGSVVGYSNEVYQEVFCVCILLMIHMMGGGLWHFVLDP